MSRETGNAPSCSEFRVDRSTPKTASNRSEAPVGTLGANLVDLSRNVASIRIHEHVCGTFQSPEQESGAAKAFFDAGFKNKERCAYFGEPSRIFRNPENAPEIQKRFDRESRLGALILLPFPMGPAGTGGFESNAMLELLQRLASTAETDGFRSLRVSIDMTSLATPGSDHGRLVDYENRLTHFFRRFRASGLCHYRRSHSDQLAVRQCVLRHPLVLHEDIVCQNHWFIPPHISDTAKSELECLLDQLVEHHRHHI
jgi:hypothetical protein